MIDIFEVFEQPLLSEVVLELRFPIRLKIPDYIKDFQEKVIKEFPNLKEEYLTRFTIFSEEASPMPTEKVWEFSNPEINALCRVLKNRFSIISNEYKSWKAYNSKKGFRDVLEFTLEKFLETYSIKKFDRIGLRYINKIEMKEKSSDWLKKLFIPIFNLEKYPIEDLNENIVRLRVIKEDQIDIVIQSTFFTEDKKDYYILDFDAYLTEIEDINLMSKADQLHEVILKEFHSLITDDCRKMMRGETKNEKRK